nr:immunoglobulin heavy chain junction region [Macaca mulatta]
CANGRWVGLDYW